MYASHCKKLMKMQPSQVARFRLEKKLCHRDKPRLLMARYFPSSDQGTSDGPSGGELENKP